MSNFCGSDICSTYQSILNVGTSNNDVLPSTPGSQIIVTDGLGNSSSLKIGQENQGATVTGDLSATGRFYTCDISYPTSDGTACQVIRTDGTGNLSFDSVCNLIPSGSTAIGTSTTYNNLSTITVDTKGRVNNVTTNTNILNLVCFTDPVNVFSSTSLFEYTNFSLPVPENTKAVILETCHQKDNDTPSCIITRKADNFCSYMISYFNSSGRVSLVGSSQGTYPVSASNIQISLTGGSVESASINLIGYWI